MSQVVTILRGNHQLILGEEKKSSKKQPESCARCKVRPLDFRSYNGLGICAIINDKWIWTTLGILNEQLHCHLKKNNNCFSASKIMAPNHDIKEAQIALI